MQLETITKLLDLPNFKVIKVSEHHENSLHLYVDQADSVDPICSACGSVHHDHVHSIISLFASG
jgi:hypothetical protein